MATNPAPSNHAILLDVPFEAQKDQNLCGLASLSMIARYYGKSLSPDLAGTLRSEAQIQKGLSGSTLKMTLENLGFFVAVFHGTLDRGETSLLNHLDFQRPLIVLLGNDPGHYWVVRGYDPDQGILYFLDPSRGPGSCLISDFVKLWHQADAFTLLALPDPPGQDAPAEGPSKGGKK